MPVLLRSVAAAGALACWLQVLPAVAKFTSGEQDVSTLAVDEPPLEAAVDAAGRAEIRALEAVQDAAASLSAGVLKEATLRGLAVAEKENDWIAGGATDEAKAAARAIATVGQKQLDGALQVVDEVASESERPALLAPQSPAATLDHSRPSLASESEILMLSLPEVAPVEKRPMDSLLNTQSRDSFTTLQPFAGLRVNISEYGRSNEPGGASTTSFDRAEKFVTRVQHMVSSVEAQRNTPRLSGMPATQRHYFALAAIGCILVMVACVIGYGFGKSASLPAPQMLHTQVPTLVAQRRRLQVLHIVQYFFDVVFCSVVVPASYHLASDFGFQNVVAVVLVCLADALYGVGVIIARVWSFPWNQRWSAWIVTASQGGCVILAILYAFGADPPADLMLSAEYRLGFLVASRLPYGLCSSVATCLLKMMVVQITPHEELTQLTMYSYGSLKLGHACGPLIGTLLIWALDAQTVRAAASKSVYALALTMFATFCAMSVLLPNDLNQLLSAKAYQDTLTAETQSETVPTWHSSMVGQVLNLRHLVCVLGVFLGSAQAFIMSSLETATTIILFEKSSYTAFDMELVLGIVCIYGLPVVMLLQGAQQLGFASERKVLVWSAALCMAAVPFLPTSENAKIGFGPLLGVLANAIYFPFGFVVHGISESLALKYAMPSSWSCRENFITLSYLGQTLFGNFLAPPLTALILNRQGQDPFAAFLFALVVLSWFYALVMKAALSSVDETEEATGSQARGPCSAAVSLTYC
eukprot:TRINITY_DN27189_c0_g1_i1.p1 TRINITY_DN27189_c0_g1~~TRINITY_DN27189_c0_g1_i1.p1  ORF type:complete len:756 (-),score=121.72 TRINITY_DN27189_c0_g1_i1:168-2435(-)